MIVEDAGWTSKSRFGNK